MIPLPSLTGGRSREHSRLAKASVENIINILGFPMRMGFFFLDTGGTAQAFFAEKNRDAVADLYQWDSDEDREKFKEFHRAVAITLRLMSCTETIDVEMMERHNTYTKG